MNLQDQFAAMGKKTLAARRKAMREAERWYDHLNDLRDEYDDEQDEIDRSVYWMSRLPLRRRLSIAAKITVGNKPR